MNNTQLINNIKNLGYKVRIRHYRTVVSERGKVLGMVRYQRKNPECKNDIINSGQKLGQFGGKTVAKITGPTGEISLGEAGVYYKDSYNYRRGAEVAIGRAWKNINRK